LVNFLQYRHQRRHVILGNQFPARKPEQVIERLSVLPVVPLDLPLVQRAVSTCQRYQISYWDGLIIAAAERADCTRIFSEDLNAGQSYNGIPLVNPF
jgi:predicted nucleic acid-binding protein